MAGRLAAARLVLKDRQLQQFRSKSGSAEQTSKSLQARSVKADKGGKGGKGNKKGRHTQYDLLVTIDILEHGLTEENVEEYKEAFMLFDKDEDGVISFTELGVIMKSLGQRPTENELEALVSAVIHKDRDQIEFNEFLRLMAKNMAEIDTERNLKEAFRVFDKDDDGYLLVGELRRVMTSLGEKMSSEEVDDMIREADKNGDGKINYAEFVHALKNGDFDKK